MQDVEIKKFLEWVVAVAVVHRTQIRNILRRGVAGVLLGAAVTWGFQPVASADNGTVTRTALASDTEFTTGGAVELIGRSITLGAGESRHVRARLEATSSTTAVVGMTNAIRCVNSSGVTVGVKSASARNHEGYDTTSYATAGHLPIYADLLFTAPSAGTYRCGLVGSTYSTSGSAYHLTAVAGNTWIEISDTAQASAGWWQNPSCESADTSGACTYVGGGAADSEAWVFYGDGTPASKWEAHPSARTVDAQANLELTTCPVGTASCASAMQDHPRGENAVVDLRFDFIQLDTTGHACATHQQSSRKTITDDAHHSVSYFAISDIPINSACGTRTFIMRIYVKYVEGQTLKIDGVQSGVTSLTNGIAFNRFS
ncbi:hypothetical protein [Streptomyces avermitilis]|uniref:hypothetical protein n=1 Tax=Streptomyces avermitilis TaxID=33903 RepID=UPI0036978A69